MVYKIVKITNLRGEDKLYDNAAMSRIGLIVDIDKSDVHVGRKGSFFVDESKTISTSLIKEIIVENDLVVITTSHSVYYLKEVLEKE